jgi:dCTP deaminase
MTALSDHELFELIRDGDMRVEPTPRALRGASVPLTLDGRIFRTTGDETGEVDVFSVSSYPKLHSAETIPDEGFVIEPGEFVLATSVEHISIPKSCCGLLSNISGLARLGLQTVLSTNVAPGYGETEAKPITLEIINLSSRRIRMYAGMRVCHLTVLRLGTPATSSYDDEQSRYANPQSPSSQYGMPAGR